MRSNRNGPMPGPPDVRPSMSPPTGALMTPVEAKVFRTPAAYVVGMEAEVMLANAAGLPVRSWAVVDGHLRLRFFDASEDRTLRCNDCGRFHWILETRFREGRGVLAVRCHTCGANGNLLLAEFRVPPP